MEEGVRLGQSDPLDRWAIGDLCIEAVPPGSGRPARSEAQRRLVEFAAQTQLTVGLLKDCYRTSEAWPVGTRIPGISHGKHSTYASKPNRVNLLLNEDLDDGLPTRVRDKVAKAEELLGDPAVRAAILDRSKKRSRSVVAAARAVEDEDLTRARVHQRLEEQHAKAMAAAPEILSRMAERAIRGNQILAKMISDLLELRSIVSLLPANYHERTTDHLKQIQRAASLVLEELQPEPRSPQPSEVIDMHVD